MFFARTVICQTGDHSSPTALCPGCHIPYHWLGRWLCTLLRTDKPTAAKRSEFCPRGPFLSLVSSFPLLLPLRGRFGLLSQKGEFAYRLVGLPAKSALRISGAFMLRPTLRMRAGGSSACTASRLANAKSPPCSALHKNIIFLATWVGRGHAGCI